MSGPIFLPVGVIDCQFGNDVKIIQPSNLYGCCLGDNCFVGPFVEIQRRVTLGARTRVQSHSFICELVTIGDDCFIGHGVMFINDRFATGAPAGGNEDLWETTLIGDGVSIGSNATILPVSIVSGCVIGAGSVVTKDLNTRGVYTGNPVRMIREL